MTYGMQWLMTGVIVLAAIFLFRFDGGRLPPDIREKMLRMQPELEEIYDKEGRVTPRYKIFFGVALLIFLFLIWVVLPRL